MTRTFTQLSACASIIGAVVMMTTATPAAQQQTQLQAPITQEAMDRAQAAYQADLLRQAIARDKEAVVANLMERWRAEIGENEKGLQGFKASFLAADTEKLVRLNQAKTWDGVIAASLGLSPDATIGSKANDLVFTPLTPCRVFDSRLGTGAFAGPYVSGQTIGIYVTDNLNSGGRNQGGPATCGYPFNIGSAVALNITVVPVSGSGDLKIFPYGGASPNASIINFYAGLNLANATSAGIALGNSANDLNISVEFASSVHIIVDILGYYSQPQATSFDTVRVASAATVVASGGFYSLDSPTCPTGYSLVSGGYNETQQISGLWVWQNGPADAAVTTWRFRGYNASAGNTSVTVYGVCARTFGR